MTINDKIIRNKVGLLNLAQELGNVSKACRVMGFSRDTFYRYKSAMEEGGPDSLMEKSRKGPNFKNRVDQCMEDRVVAIALENPAPGQQRVSNQPREEGLPVSAAGVRSVWPRHKLQTMEPRLIALEKRVAEEGIILTESQLVALEQKKEYDKAHGEIETEHPGYPGAQDTFHVGTLKGVGRVYQQTFIDTYSKVAFGKLYQMKTPITAADLLNDRVLPFFEEQGMGIPRILTDRGTEYCGKQDSRDYRLYLALNNIDHSRTKAKHPQTNGICERFHKTVLREFYQIAFGKKIYREIGELQKDLDEWLGRYNHERTHQGKMCCGRTPMAAFQDGKHIWKEKIDFQNANSNLNHVA